MTENLPAPYQPPSIYFKPSDLANIRDLYARDALPAEFQRFIAMCKARGLDPRLGHAYLFLFNTDEKAQKAGKRRQAVTVISEGGYLTAADRCRDERGNPIYLPDDEVPRFVYKEALIDKDTNPLGIESCTVSVRKFVQGQWHSIPAQVFWDERAPIIEGGDWVDYNGRRKFVKNGKMALDPKKEGWIRQGRNMLAKCARVAACRYAFPDQMGGLYSEEERDALERGAIQVIDLTPDQIIEEHTHRENLKAIGADNTISLIFDIKDGVQKIPLGLTHDEIERHLRANPDPAYVKVWVERNRTGIKEFMAIGGKDEWLDLKKAIIDPAAEALKQQAKQQQEQGNEPI